MDSVGELQELRERQEFLRGRVLKRISTLKPKNDTSSPTTATASDASQQKDLAQSIKQALATMLLNPLVDLPLDSKTLAKQVSKAPSVVKQAEVEGITLNKDDIEKHITLELESLNKQEAIQIEIMAVAPR